LTKAANRKQALDPKPRAFSLADQARGIALQNKSVQARQDMSRTQERMGDAAKLQHDILVTGRQRKCPFRTVNSVNIKLK